MATQVETALPSVLKSHVHPPVTKLQRELESSFLVKKKEKKEKKKQKGSTTFLTSIQLNMPIYPSLTSVYLTNQGEKRNLQGS